MIDEKINIPLALNDGTKITLAHRHGGDEAITELEFLGDIDESGVRVHALDQPFQGTEAEIIAYAMGVAEDLRQAYLTKKGKKAKREAKQALREAAKEHETTEATEAETETAESEDPDDSSPHIEYSEYEKHLKCYLTEEEKAKAAANLVQRMEDLTRKNDALTAIKNQFKGEVARIEADISHYQSLVRDGYEFHDVPCRVARNYETENITITRLDTGEIIEDRRMYGSELQRTLPGMG